MRHTVELLLCASVFTVASCKNDTSQESREVREFPEIEIGRVKRRTKIYEEKGVYCAAYRPNYEYYCVGIWSGEKLTMSSRHLQRIKKFCPTYKHHCISHKSSHTHRRKHNRRDRDGSEEKLRSKSYEEILKELSEIVPCTPECDANVHPHCTQECKCDYDYPRMQRFCNPPALAMFLNVCRLWYNQCPKYEQYHYSSQFIYSKAEKGKTVATPLPVVDETWRQSFYRRQG
ncbi:hypothetical protein Aduo_008638 [Ancylostoma duodenale]